MNMTAFLTPNLLEGDQAAFQNSKIMQLAMS